VTQAGSGIGRAPTDASAYGLHETATQLRKTRDQMRVAACASAVNAVGRATDPGLIEGRLHLARRRLIGAWRQDITSGGIIVDHPSWQRAEHITLGHGLSYRHVR